MIKKIISGGQTGADQAALDSAIQLDMPHGGWVPKGRITQEGSLPDKYKLQEIPDDSYPSHTEQNVIDSDGTVIITHGKLYDGSDYAREMSVKHGRPWIKIDLDITAPLDAALKISNWIIENSIAILNITGSSADKDPKIYEKTRDIIDGVIHLTRVKDKHDSLDPLSAEAIVPKTVSEAVSRLISRLSLKDKTTIANMTVDELDSLQVTLGGYIRHFFQLWIGNKELMASCRFVSKGDVPSEDVASMVIIRELWEKLRKTHKLKVVK
jgi:hypothetical protein